MLADLNIFLTFTWSFDRFLYADPTPSALQVFLNRPGESQSGITGLPSEEGLESGIWINADPIPGCVVCNIGESKLSKHIATTTWNLNAERLQCGKSGQMVCIDQRYTVSSIGVLIIGDDPFFPLFLTGLIHAFQLSRVSWVFRYSPKL